MADRKKNESRFFDLKNWDNDDFQAEDVSEPLETKYDPHDMDIEDDFNPPDVSTPEDIGDQANELIDDEDFEAPDVSEPRQPRKEIEVIEEALAIRRREWLKKHMSYIYAGIGIIIVGVIIFLIYFLNKNSNPMSRMLSSVSKDFSTSFHYDLEMTENGTTVMSYDGDISVNRSKHQIEAVYNADYNNYTYTGVVAADDQTAMRGAFYNNKWMVHDCFDSVQDFFDFDRSLRKGQFNGGAFLRFTGLTSDYSTREMENFVDTIKNRLSTDSSIAKVTTEKIDGGTRYHYDIDLKELLEMIVNEGASVFYRASDYNKFAQAYSDNKATIQNAKFTVDFTVNSAGYMTSFDALLNTGGNEFGLSCNMSDFGRATPQIPDGFEEAVEQSSVRK